MRKNARRIERNMPPGGAVTDQTAVLLMKPRFILTLLFTIGSIAGTSATAQEVPLPLELPRPLFVGTPTPIKLPHLEAPRQGKRPDFMVPEGTKLLSRGKPVTSSDDFPIIGELDFITDGDKSGVDGTFVELGPDLQWVQIDLEQPADIEAIVVWHNHAQPRAYHDVIVQISDHPEFESGAKTVFNNDHDNSSGFGRGEDPAYLETYEGRLIDAKDTRGRYVRLYSNGNTSDELNTYVEVEVWGRPAN